MKYILVHEETCVLAVVQTTPSFIEEIATPKSGLHILKEYPDNVSIRKYQVYGINEDNRTWDGFIYSSPDDVHNIFHMLYPNDRIEAFVEYDI